ncbi:hypothetical protein BBROOKSOX_1308 [Bathymodiolus brooksi thiotrophic gill symbiont]|nr:hypothetical protein BBROOKSOX_1308 [Bathymodiolus brooksi thiotrophic gill symbiont]
MLCGASGLALSIIAFGNHFITDVASLTSLNELAVCLLVDNPITPIFHL